nr:o-succinylbenzoate synthase [Gemmatimonadaceae bacterium]
DVRRVLLLELVNSDGTRAWSECVAESLPSYSPDTVDSCWLAISEWLAPRLAGATFTTPRDVNGALSLGIRGHRMARAALEMGVWALDAERRGLSLAALLFTESATSRAGGAMPRALVDTGVAIGIQGSANELADRARAAVAEGYRRIRIKIEPGRDVEPARDVREAVGDAVPVVVDANASYSLDDTTHVLALESLDTLGLWMIEQPLGSEDLVRHAELQRRMRTRLCLDESITSDARAEEMLRLGSARGVNLKAGRVGGFTEALAIHDRCTRAGTALWCGGMLETGIGRAYNVALASLPGFTEPGDLSPSARYWARDITEPEWTMSATGQVQVPLERAGIGVAVREDAIDDLTTRRLVIGS